MKTKPYQRQKKKLALNSELRTYQILTDDDEVCIPSLSSILLAVSYVWNKLFFVKSKQLGTLKIQ